MEITLTALVTCGPFGQKGAWGDCCGEGQNSWRRRTSGATVQCGVTAPADTSRITLSLWSAACNRIITIFCGYVASCGIARVTGRPRRKVTTFRSVMATMLTHRAQWQVHVYASAVDSLLLLLLPLMVRICRKLKTARAAICWRFGERHRLRGGEVLRHDLTLQEISLVFLICGYFGSQ